jgi:diaminopimelate decarboxylase
LNDTYMPPLISGELGQGTPQAAADRNLYARGTHSVARAKIDGLSINALIEKFGSPLFVFSERDLRAKPALHDGFARSGRWPLVDSHQRAIPLGPIVFAAIEMGLPRCCIG